MSVTSPEVVEAIVAEAICCAVYGATSEESVDTEDISDARKIVEYLARRGYRIEMVPLTPAERARGVDQ